MLRSTIHVRPVTLKARCFALDDLQAPAVTSQLPNKLAAFMAKLGSSRARPPGRKVAWQLTPPAAGAEQVDDCVWVLLHRALYPPTGLAAGRKPNPTVVIMDGQSTTAWTMPVVPFVGAVSHVRLHARSMDHPILRLLPVWLDR